MKKRWITGITILTMAVGLTACGETAKTTETTESVRTDSKQETSVDYDNSSLEGIRDGIENDFSDTIQKITEKLEETNSSVGNSYEEYIENKQLITDWYAFAISEEDALFQRTIERSVEYYKLIATSIDPADYDARDDAMEAFYDDVYDDLMDNFYDEIYDDAMDEVYDTYYDGIVEDGYDVAPYEKWSEESSACYKEWSEASSSIYKSWSDTSSKLYGYWSAVSSGFYQKNFDVDAIIQKYEEEKSKSETEETKSENTSAEQEESSQIEGIRPEFQEAMDSYEAFFDEYVSFMKEYENASQDDILGMMDEYTDYLKQYTETMSKMEALDDGDLSTEEALYYAEVTSRISKKLIEVAQ